MKCEIEIEVQGDSFSSFEEALQEAVKGILKGCLSGLDKNDSSNYSFQVTSQEEEGDDHKDFYWNGET